MRILVTGSRTWTDTDVIWGAFCDNTFNVLDRHTLVHGGAAGADSIAGDQAKTLGWDVEVHPADWERYGKRAGFIRNAEMVKLGADVCLAFIKENSRGASMTVDLANKAGIPVVRFDS